MVAWETSAFIPLQISMSKNNSQESSGIHLRNLATEWSKKPENNHIRREERFKGLVCLYHPSPVTLCLEGPPSKKGLPLPRKEGFPCGSAGKESACNVEDLGSIPGLGRSPGEGRGYPLQYSGLESSMDCIVHGVAKSQTRLSNFHFHFAKQRRVSMAFHLTEQTSAEWGSGEPRNLYFNEYFRWFWYVAEVVHSQSRN